jgi:zinc protease
MKIRIVGKGVAKCIAAAGLLTCALVSGTPGLAATAPAATAPTPAVAFPQDFAPDLKADPEVRYGRLPNGFTYIIRKNATPAGNATVFMRVRAGSMMETDKQRGLAHFIEHMAFNGTTHIAEGDLKKILERHGFAFGADANAYTTDAKTVYTLSTPKTDAETLDTALFIMREIAGNMTLNAGAIDRERGVILGEERVRDTPSLHASDAMNHWMFAGQRYADHALPIGSVDIIKTAPRSELAAFYNTWYRPELTTLIVVGDFDPDQMEAKIKADFADWTAKGPMPAEPDWGPYKPQGLRAFTYTEKDLRETLSLNWIKPVDTTHDSQAKRLGNLYDGAILSTLNRRFDNKMAEPGTAFLAAYVSRSNEFKTGRVLNLSLVPRPGMARQAFEQAYDILHTFTARGLTPHEVEDLITVLDTTKTTQAANDKTRGSGAMASDMLSLLDGDGVFLGSADGIALLDAARPGLTQANLNARMKDLFGGDGPALTHVGDSLGDFDEGELKSDYQAVSSLSAAVYTEKLRKPWPYTDFGPAAAPVSHTVDTDFGYGHYVYPNGVVLNVKPTKLTANQIFIQVDFPGGMFRFDPKANRPYPLATSSIFTSGGLGKMTESQYEATLYGKSIRAHYYLRDNSTLLTGGTTPTDLPTELQLLAAYATDPGYRHDGFNSLLNTWQTNLKGIKSAPLNVLNYNIEKIMLSSDRRYDATIMERVDSINFDDIKSIMAESLKDTPIIITIVGDVDEAQAVDNIGKTFGALPPRPATAPKFPGADHFDFPPKQREYTLYHEGRDDQSVSVAVWPTVGFYKDTQESRGLTVLADIIQNRLFDALREKEGADYSPVAASSQDDNVADFGFLQARTTIKAGGDTDFRAALEHIVADLKAKPVTDDELLRVKKPIFEAIDNNVKNNGYWMTVLPGIEIYGAKERTAQLNKRAQYDAVTADQLMQLARKYLRDDTVIHIKVIPGPKTADAKPTGATTAVKPVAAKPAPPPIPVAPKAQATQPPSPAALPKPVTQPVALVPAAPKNLAAKPVSLAPAAAKPITAKPVSAAPMAPKTATVQASVTTVAKPVTVKPATPAAVKPAPTITATPRPLATPSARPAPSSPAKPTSPQTIPESPPFGTPSENVVR